MPLMYFIAGMLFMYCLIPSLESITSLFVTWLSRIESQESAKIYKIKQALTEEENTTKTVIGFAYEEEEE